MIFINIIVEGNTEEIFVNDVLVKHFAKIGKYVSARKITTGWDKLNKKPAKGGMLQYSKFRNDVINWIKSDNGKPNTYYTSFIDLYAFPLDAQSPFIERIRQIQDPYLRINALEVAIGNDINNPTFLPYVQLHEFEALLLVQPDTLLTMYPESTKAIKSLINEIGNTIPELVNDNPLTAPSKRIIKYIPEYKGQKAQVGPLVAEEIGLHLLREKCVHFNEWLTKLENL